MQSKNILVGQMSSGYRVIITVRVRLLSACVAFPVVFELYVFQSVSL